MGRHCIVSLASNEGCAVPVVCLSSDRVQCAHNNCYGIGFFGLIYHALVFIVLLCFQVLARVEPLLLDQPKSFTDAQVWDLVAELREHGITLGSNRQLSVASQASSGGSVVGKEDAKAAAAAEEQRQRQLQAVGERLARHFATFSPEQRAGALAAAGAENETHGMQTA